MQAAIDRLDNLLGGHVYEDTALNAEGVAERGKFAVIGPLVVFASNDGKAGLAEELRGSTDRKLVDIESARIIRRGSLLSPAAAPACCRSTRRWATRSR